MLSLIDDVLKIYNVKYVHVLYHNYLPAACTYSDIDVIHI